MMHDGYGMMPGLWIMLFIAVLVVVPVWRICVKAGYSGWLSLLVVVPIANLLLLYFLGFAEWPLERRASPSSSPTP
jgi:hypothetical protein